MARCIRLLLPGLRWSTVRSQVYFLSFPGGLFKAYIIRSIWITSAYMIGNNLVNSRHCKTHICRRFWTRHSRHICVGKIRITDNQARDHKSISICNINPSLNATQLVQGTGWTTITEMYTSETISSILPIPTNSVITDYNQVYQFRKVKKVHEEKTNVYYCVK